MKKRIACLLTVFLLCLGLIFQVHASSPLLVDEADLLTEPEEQALLAKLSELRDLYQMDIVIVTANSLQGKSAEAYADDFYDAGDYSRNGMLLLVCMEYRDYAISTFGYGITAATERGLDYLEDQFLPYLSSGNYSRAFERFIDGCDYLISRANERNTYSRPPIRLPLSTIFVCTVIGVIAAFVVTGSMKRKLKSVVRQDTANSYIRPGGLTLTQRQDVFLYRNVTRVARPRDDNHRGGGGSRGGGSRTHISSSGRVHGGRSGKF